jgi:polyphosphate glucokinase
MTTGTSSTAAGTGRVPQRDWPADVRTLAIDVGGSGFKAAVLDARGEMTSERVRVDTPYPCPPETFVRALSDLVAELHDPYDRVSVGFPGLVRRGLVHHIPSLSRRTYGGGPDAELVAAWDGFDLGSALRAAFAVPVKVANDADVQGCAVATGNGFELVVTLGTGVGTALFSSGVLLPHLELGHAQFRKGETFEEQLGNTPRKAVGNERWQARVLKALQAYDRFLFYDHVFLGGGNAKHLAEVPLPDNATIVPNTAGILGGLRLWDMDLHV